MPKNVWLSDLLSLWLLNKIYHGSEVNSIFPLIGTIADTYSLTLSPKLVLAPSLQYYNVGLDYSFKCVERSALYWRWTSSSSSVYTNDKM